ncbi:hypothetical protein N802_03460 [Knoellia sinensis KCTC 19936]|uniref:Uncharacterized protein n=1 Tax=Knoellia sinensis KCTC 19936 TaxID=1385520 RepID=A0A0A0J2S4_9MICO|nr:hypothetical protein [Knoellia sinensis]KGN31433.1 hypothetical protein N802_03460 [Knoellia sinensis KCTC 19936]
MISAYLVALAKEPLPWSALIALGATSLGAMIHAIGSAIGRLSYRMDDRRSNRFRDIFGHPSRATMIVGAGLGVVAWALLLIGVAAPSQGVPYSDGPENCQYYLADAGKRKCVPLSEYQQELATQTSLGFAAAGFFFALSSIVVMSRAQRRESAIALTGG